MVLIICCCVRLTATIFDSDRNQTTIDNDLDRTNKLKKLDMVQKNENDNMIAFFDIVLEKRSSSEWNGNKIKIIIQEKNYYDIPHDLVLKQRHDNGKNVASRMHEEEYHENAELKFRNHNNNMEMNQQQRHGCDDFVTFKNGNVLIQKRTI